MVQIRLYVLLLLFALLCGCSTTLKDDMVSPGVNLTKFDNKGYKSIQLSLKYEDIRYWIHRTVLSTDEYKATPRTLEHNPSGYGYRVYDIDGENIYWGDNYRDQLVQIAMPFNTKIDYVEVYHYDKESELIIGIFTARDIVAAVEE